MSHLAPPANSTPEFVAGWTARAIADGTEPVTATPNPTPAPTPTPAVRVIAPTENFQTVIDTAPPSETQFALDPKASYKGTGNWTPKRGNFTLNGQGASVVFSEPAGASSIIRTTSPGARFENLIVSVAAAGNFDMFRFQADSCAAIGCTLTGPTIATFGMADVGGTKALFQGNTIPLVNSVAVYLSEDDAHAIGNTFTVGSAGETVLRVDNPAVTPVRCPQRVIVSGNTFFTVGGANQKGCVEWRSAGSGCVFQSNTCHDYVRVGQDGMTLPGQSIAGLQILGNTFIGAGPEPVNLMIKNGVILIGTASNHFSVVHPITMSGPAEVTFNPATTAAAADYNKANVPANVKVTGGY
jgi:hypothetical protein